VNQQVNVTATVTGQYGGIPTGTVIFSSNGVQIGSPVPVAARQANISTSFQSTGTYAIVAVYSGDANFTSGSAAPLSESIKPQIQFNGVVLDSSQTQMVAVGQQISLTLVPSDQQTGTWTIPGKIVGGYTTSPPCPATIVSGQTCCPTTILPTAVTPICQGAVDPAPPPTQPNQVFYWIVPNAPSNHKYTVVYNYQTQTGGTGSVTATFNVAGPTGIPSAPTTPGAGPGGTFLNLNPLTVQCGQNNAQAACVQFPITYSSPPGYPAAQPVFVQLINNEGVTEVTSTSQKQLCSPGPGLDSTYPYPYIPTLFFGTTDTPIVFLYTTDGYGPVKVNSLNWNATMYFLWRADQSSTTIPVPLGSAKWVWSVQATLQGGVWTIPPQSIHLTMNPVNANPTYPTWSAVSNKNNQ
jgi:hypothetical protein